MIKKIVTAVMVVIVMVVLDAAWSESLFRAEGAAEGRCTQNGRAGDDVSVNDISVSVGSANEIQKPVLKRPSDKKQTSGQASSGQTSKKAVKKKVRAARSVHLAYKGPVGTMFYNEVVVEKSRKGSYFCVCGFSGGYFGLQERRRDKIIIFSVWDPGKQNDPKAVDTDRRVNVLYKADDVYVGRFGGEGTGGQCFYRYN